MSLVSCPECGHQVSASATSCPSCGRPIRQVRVMEPVRESSIPPWVFVIFGVLTIVVIFALFLFLRSDSGADTNVNVNVASRRSSSDTVRDREPETRSDVPVTSAPAQSQTVPGTGSQVAPPDHGTVTIRAQVARPKGDTQPARGTKFYLLDRDVQEILNEARVEPIAGNSLLGSIGLAAVFPDRYRDFQRAAESAIAKHVEYSVTTGSDGSAGIASIKPNTYYIFGITKVGNGFALWSSPVSVSAGQNNLDLAPQSVTDIPAAAG